jgi:hypothetical protein
MLYNSSNCQFCDTQYVFKHLKRHEKKCIFNPDNIPSINKILNQNPLTRKDLHNLLLKYQLQTPWYKYALPNNNDWFNIFLNLLFKIEEKYPGQIDFEIIDYYYIRLFQKYYYYDLKTYNERIDYAQQVLDINISPEIEQLFLINVALHNINDKEFITSFAPEIMEKGQREYYDSLIKQYQ